MNSGNSTFNDIKKEYEILKDSLFHTILIYIISFFKYFTESSVTEEKKKLYFSWKINNILYLSLLSNLE